MNTSAHEKPQPQRQRSDTALENTPAGAVPLFRWSMLDQAIMAFIICIMVHAHIHTTVATDRFWYVIFRGGSVMRVYETDPEWGGYPPQAGSDFLLADNVHVWETQRALPLVGKVVRQAFAALINLGFPSPKTPENPFSTVWPVQMGVALETIGLQLWIVWPRSTDTFNIVFAQDVKSAAAHGCTARQNDFTAPEVAAIFTPEHDLWRYQPDGSFAAINCTSEFID